MTQVINVNRFVIEELEKENTKIAKRVLNFLDKDRVIICLTREGGFYFERVSDIYSIPNYIHGYLVKKLKRILKTHYVFDDLFAVSK